MGGAKNPTPGRAGLSKNTGADDRDRTGDLVLTKDVLYLLSYISPSRYSLVAGEGFEPSTSGL